LGNQQDLVKQVDYFKEIGKHLEAKRRTNFDLEMIGNWVLFGNRNYSRYLDGRLQELTLLLVISQKII
jgi:excinuclease ABC subunit B